MVHSGRQHLADFPLEHAGAADPHIQIVYPVHLNPNVQQSVYSLLSGIKILSSSPR
jgi:UDP-N-acetylglucosamine 2-epimerase